MTKKLEKSYLDQRIIDRIEEKKEKIDEVRPFPKAVLKNLQEEMIVDWTYNSNAIEGNTLSLGETRLVLEEGITIHGKPLKDHLEATNHKEALLYLFKIIKQKKKIDQNLIKKLHQIVVKGIEKEYAGIYRTGQVRILGADFIPPNYIKISKLIIELIKWYYTEAKKMYIIDQVAIFHHRFETIHPFFDGNGRTGRLLMNVKLMEKGYPPIIVANNERKKYLNALNKANQDDYRPLVLFFAITLEKYLDVYLRAIAKATRYQKEMVPLQGLSKKVPYSQEYLSLLARQGKIHALKKGKVWYSSKEDIENYLNKRQKKK
ncbi:Fic family protein [Patescibacteria group bacterium]|nr:Fic family protein [Patescibacteria group bacterium]MBU1673290.1 Fic family protein [Patescibacteria group bacterium]MBU1963200.1 Fic family protein [Patescibacteria group bacterium]